MLRSFTKKNKGIETDLSDPRGRGNKDFRDMLVLNVTQEITALAERQWISPHTLELLLQALQANHLDVKVASNSTPIAPVVPSEYPGKFASASIVATTAPPAYEPRKAALPAAPHPPWQSDTKQDYAQPKPHPSVGTFTPRSVSNPLKSIETSGGHLPRSATLPALVSNTAASLSSNPSQLSSISTALDVPPPLPARNNPTIPVSNSRQATRASTTIPHRFVPQPSSPLASNVMTSQAPATVQTPPARAPKPQRRIVVAIADFDTSEPEDLPFRVGDMIAVSEDVDENWYKGTLRGKSGIFPKSFVKAR
ncbi:hypothetical protein DFS34DRAFT_609744 [Phlyctochytrium arcticum]|nr:hypothetical protein DFS34DRAFT_609744 [Phlyctochytrium arcticum]